MASLALFLLLLLNLSSYHVSSQRVVEDGYTVTTVIDGHKLKINPHAVLPQPGSSDLLVLDSSNSSVYTLSFPISQESVVKRLSGNGIDGYSDGESSKAEFKNPRSFAVDVKGNVYVADRKNHAIRKISKLGVSTIAGGYTQKPGRDDGPGQNATFSDDFEVVFVPEICALLISDHGHMLVRRIDLKAEDCVRGSNSGLGTDSVWVLGLGLSCLFGLIVGLFLRPYIIRYTGTPQSRLFHRDMEALPNQSGETSTQPRLFHRDMEALPNQSGETSTDTLLRHQKRSC